MVFISVVHMIVLRLSVVVFLSKVVFKKAIPKIKRETVESAILP